MASGLPTLPLPQRTFHCQNCGSEVATSVEQRSYICPFCASTYVTELPVGQSGKQRPEFIIGFAITAEEAKKKFFQWLKENSWFRPGDLALRAAAEKQRGVYLPFWHFTMLARSRWSARIGEYWYRTETYTVRGANGKTETRTRQVRETEWWPLAGEYERYYYGYLVSAAKGITSSEASSIQPFDVSALVRYQPFYLAGWMAEEYQLEKDQAAQQTEQEFRRRQENEISSFMPGDTYSDLRVSTELRESGSDLILLPVHVLSYRYRDNVYHFLVNGQTGRVSGDKPVSAARVAAFVIFVIVCLAVIAAVIWLLQKQN